MMLKKIGNYIKENNDAKKNLMLLKKNVINYC